MGKKKRIIALQLHDFDGCPYATISIAFGEFIGLMFTTYVDTNNNPWAEEFLQKNGIGIKTSFTKASGYCEYPLYAINPAYVRKCLGDDIELISYLEDYNFDGKKMDYTDYFNIWEERTKDFYQMLEKQNN